ncbi:MAG: DnaD domain protein [Lachnospiraceae bacterium]|nr:DnaD domain protein [Lachnospiraceae bacterium]
MKIYTDTQEGFTVIQNSFIDQYMPHANGEFVKVYLYLLRCADSGCELSLSSIADVFEHTEKDVRRALVYWERQNLLRMKLSAEGVVESVTFTDPGYYSKPVIITEEVEDSAALYSDGMESYSSPVYLEAGRACADTRRNDQCLSRPEDEDASRRGQDTPSIERNALRSAPVGVKRTFTGCSAPHLDGAVEAPLRYAQRQDAPSIERNASHLDGAVELQGLFQVAEQYLQRPLSSTEQSDFVYYYQVLHFSTDLIEYLLEYCITRGKVSTYYMRKVAQGWAEAGITTVQEAKKETTLYNKNYFTIMRAFGIKGRNPAPPEKEMMDRWLEEYAFPVDMILEATRRTINQTHEPNFQYADKILEKWHAEGIHSMKDVEAADQKWEQAQTARKKAQKNTQGRGHTGTANRFNNFTQREYDYDNLEKKLYGQS